MHVALLAEAIMKETVLLERIVNFPVINLLAFDAGG
jgi:hypothetical protein